MNVNELMEFEREVSAAFERREIPGPVHLCGGLEDQLIAIFAGIPRSDWVFATYRNHLHALLHGIPKTWLMDEIKAGRSMNIFSPEHNFFSSAIVGGCLPIAVGTAFAIKRMGSDQGVWCFIGDMAASIGVFQDALQFSEGHDLPIHFIVEDNGFSCNSPTLDCWGREVPEAPMVTRIKYNRTYPHMGIGKWVTF